MGVFVFISVLIVFIVLRIGRRLFGIVVFILGKSFIIVIFVFMFVLIFFVLSIICGFIRRNGSICVLSVVISVSGLISLNII